MKCILYLQLLVLLAACSKSGTVPMPPAETKPVAGMVRFSVFADPDLRPTRPAAAEAGIRLSIMQSSFSGILPEMVWDTLLPLRQIAGFPGPDEPILIHKKLVFDPGKKHVIYLTAHKMYRIRQEIKVEEISKGVADLSNLLVLKIGL
ncbi:hypothetical protein [Flavihumibacter sp. CACIAM 22H1]|uniref:hypothetical protein n=1 Tax=Flavihumibacter sp. CACIAM 22H1 TaxID=1812911 RepID=UPI0007A87021|nr:hypothetical protein [Flavihumibacter sp. CACIAM 22H1]KYP15628.1 MAG: hypothetical protein A1D16_10700 [Flavihumibacter sp. CACIAM 22H1]